MQKLELLTSLWKIFWMSEFMEGIRTRFYTMLGSIATGTTLSITPVKETAEQLTTHQVIEYLQIISLSLGILVSLTILYKFFKSLKEK